MTNLAIEATHLHKNFELSAGWRFWQATKPQTIVRDVSLQVEQGECFGLLGINGAGKTTLTKMLATLILPTSGTAKVVGYPLTAGADIRAAIGLVVTDERSFYWRLTAIQNLRFFAALHDLHGLAAEKRIKEVLQMVDLSDVADRPFRFFSSGMKQRLAIGRALLHRPRLLFLDEPSRSLDPTATAQLHQLVQQLREEQQITIFLITHDLAEAETLCQRVAIMHQGTVEAAGTPKDLRQQVQASTVYQLWLNQAPATWAPTLPPYQIEQTADAAILSFQATAEENHLTAVVDHLRDHQINIIDLISERPSLADVFDQLTDSNRPSH